MTLPSRARLLALALAAVALAAPAAAQTTAQQAAAPLAIPNPDAPPLPKPAASLNETQQYCQNIAAAAADARFAWQRKQLNDLDAQLKQRIADLETREAAFKEVLAHREAVMKQAADTVVGIFSQMKPDAAAQQIAALDDEMASAILAQLTQKKASLVLDEIPADRAAKLITAITASAGVGRKS